MCCFHGTAILTRKAVAAHWRYAVTDKPQSAPEDFSSGLQTQINDAQ